MTPTATATTPTTTRLFTPPERRSWRTKTQKSAWQSRTIYRSYYIEHQTVYSPASGLHFDPLPEEALPQQTFAVSYKLQANGETLALQHVAPAHTDSDIYIHFEKANVIQMGDLFFNGMYPFIDSSTGGKITGMIAAADKILSLAGNDTKIVAGHGPLGNKADLTKFRDMLVTSRDRVEALGVFGQHRREQACDNVAKLEIQAVLRKGGTGTRVEFRAKQERQSQSIRRAAL